jgi:hypothetical protein
MAFNIRLARTLPSLGTTRMNDGVLMRAGVALTGTAAQTTPIPATGVLRTPTTAGKIRVKIYGGGAATITNVVVSASDGTNSCMVATLPGGTLSATSFYDQMADYLVDTATTTGAGGGAIGQLSAAAGGATSFQVVTTLSAGTATMDVELCPTL